MSNNKSLSLNVKGYQRLWSTVSDSTKLYVELMAGEIKREEKQTRMAIAVGQAQWEAMQEKVLS